MIKVPLPWGRYRTFDEILHYKSFLLPPFNITNQTDSKLWKGIELREYLLTKLDRKPGISG